MWLGTMKGIISIEFSFLRYKETWTRKAKGSFVEKKCLHLNCLEMMRADHTGCSSHTDGKWSFGTEEVRELRNQTEKSNNRDGRSHQELSQRLFEREKFYEGNKLLQENRIAAWRSANESKWVLQHEHRSCKDSCMKDHATPWRKAYLSHLHAGPAEW